MADVDVLGQAVAVEVAAIAAFVVLAALAVLAYWFFNARRRPFSPPSLGAKFGPASQAPPENPLHAPASTPAPVPSPSQNLTPSAAPSAPTAALASAPSIPSTGGLAAGESLPSAPPAPRFEEVVAGNEEDVFAPFKLYAGRHAGQQFVAKGEKLRSVAVKAFKQGTAGEFLLDVCEDDEGLPGRVLASERLAGSALSANLLGAWAVFSTDVALEEGRAYWLVFSQSGGDERNRVEVKGVFRDVFPDGIAAESEDGKMWTKRPYTDTAFKLAFAKRVA